MPTVCSLFAGNGGIDLGFKQAGTLTFALTLYDRTGEDRQGDVRGSITLEYVKEGDTVRIISPMAGLEVVPASEAVMEGEGNP